ncbi:hypothetical protein ESA94_07550 [Lacibacter luteus]|uniref:Bacterial EndoU nuclease domain-containing protein n=1 Tax=Lacibacter luteus TaxID=2508719 RepID=A0A4Q1CJ10_9BACT|nr:hypothetical protein [Lacibacter luteus]RXK60328.1 hypothetical protein ESA94_07550 [Lacibacter luteus]
MHSEQEFIKLLFLLSDTQHWLTSMSQELLAQLPNSSRLKQKSYYLSITAFAHIIERHYYRIERHPGTGKFSVPLHDIIQHIKEAKEETTQPVHGTLNHYRTKDTGTIIGHERNGTPTSLITVITCPAGKIITAFPGIP